MVRFPWPSFGGFDHDSYFIGDSVQRAIAYEFSLVRVCFPIWEVDDAGLIGDSVRGILLSLFIWVLGSFAIFVVGLRGVLLLTYSRVRAFLLV